MTKSRTLRKAGAVVLSLAMAASTLAVAPASFAATAKKVVKLNSSGKTFNAAGGSATVKIKGAAAAKIKKTTVSSSNKAVATVKKNSKVSFKVTAKKNTTTAKKTATVKAKVVLKKKKFSKKVVYTKKTYTLKYSVTVKAAEEVTPSAEPVPTPEDHSSDVKIVDVMGLQTDGTGIIGDKLKLSYGSTFGTPTAITWYRNGSVVSSYGAGNSNLNTDGGLWLTVKASIGTGIYSATVVANGKTYTTNEISITDKEDAAILKSFTIEDDYTDGKNITYDSTDKSAVATVTMNKNYTGTFSIYKKTDTKFSAPILNDTLTTSIVEATNTAAVETADAGNANNHAVLTTNAASNYQVLNADVPGSGYGIINDDGTVTYKWVLNDTGVVRNTEYVVLFDQLSITTDTAGQGKENVFATAATAPYVKAPKKIAVTKVSNGNKPEVTFYSDEEGKEVMSWFTGAASAITAAGIDDIEVYKATSKTNDKTKATALGVTDATTTAGGVTGLLKGVWTSDKTADSTAFWFAYVKTKKGIFDAAAAELTSEAVAVAQDVATDMDIVESKTTASTATVKFANLRAPGKVYIVRGSNVVTSTVSAGTYANTATEHLSTPAKIYETFDPSDPTTYTAVADVDLGTETIDIANALGNITKTTTTDVDVNGVAATVSATTDKSLAGKYGANNYIAVFVPTDEANYGKIYTDGGFSTDSYTAKADVKSALTVSQVATSLKYDKKVKGDIATDSADTLTITGTTLIAYDQFGDKMWTEQAAKDVTSVTTTDKTLANTEKANGKFSVAPVTGYATITLKMNTATDRGDGYTITALGSTITVTSLYDDTPIAKSATTADAKKTFQVKFGSDELFAPAARVITSAPTATTKNVLAVVFNTGAKDQDGFGFDISGLNGKSATTNGITATITEGNADGQFKITFAGTLVADVADDGNEVFSFTVGTKTLKFTITYDNAHNAGDNLANGDFDNVVATIV